MGWELLRNGAHSFYLKRDNVTFSTEPKNLTATHSLKYSGLANAKAIGINVEGGAIVVRRNKKTNRRKPRAGQTRQKLRKHYANGKNAAFAQINNSTGAQYYRRDLTQDAVARYQALHKAANRPAVIAPVRP